jgi:hypothetical protein
MGMKRLIPEEDDLFWLVVAVGAFLTFCISLLLTME